MRRMATTAMLAAAFGSLGLAAPAAAKLISFSGPAASSGTTVDLTLKTNKDGKPVSIPYFKVNSPYVYCREDPASPPAVEGPIEHFNPEFTGVFPDRMEVLKKRRFSGFALSGKKGDWEIDGKASKTSVTGDFELFVHGGANNPSCGTDFPVSFATTPTG